MKTKLYLVLLILGMFILFGCEDETTKPDTTLPMVQITSPENNSTISGVVDVNINASDNKGVAIVEIYIDGDWAGETTSEPWGFVWETELGENADYTLQAQAYDTSDNVGTSNLVNVTVQNAVPELQVSTSTLDFGSIETVDYFSISNIGTGTLNWEITDDQDWITVDPTSGSDEGNKSTITVTIDREGLSEGSYQGEISITSNGGSASIAVYMDVVEQIVLDEGFEGIFLPVGWLKLSPDGGTGWELMQVGTTPIPGWTGGAATACPDGGSWQAFCTWTTGGTISNDQWLITPQITVATGNILDFYMIYFFDTFVDHVEILISTTVQNNPAAFNTVVDIIDFSVGSPIDWTLYSYNLTDFVPAGTDVYIGFRESVADNLNDGSAISIDNVYVGSYQERSSVSSSPEVLKKTRAKKDSVYRDVSKTR